MNVSLTLRVEDRITVQVLHDSYANRWFVASYLGNLTLLLPGVGMENAKVVREFAIALLDAANKVELKENP